MKIKSFETFNEDSKWIKKAIKNPGSLRKNMNKKEGEKITKSELNSEISKLKNKDKDKTKKGIQGLSKKQLSRYKKLVLAKTLRKFNESDSFNNSNFGFYSSLENLKILINDLLKTDSFELNKLIEKEPWIFDNITESENNIRKVYDFLMIELKSDNELNFDSDEDYFDK